jgi:hypothetical protein
LAAGSTLTITLHDGTTACSGGTVVYTTTATATGGSSTLNVASNNAAAIGVNDQISWDVQFMSTDPNVASSSTCENSTLTIHN